MCLRTVDKIRQCPESGRGYKAFGLRDNKLYPVWRGHLACRRGRWLHAYEVQVCADDGQYYLSGFHIFDTEEDANHYITSCFDSRLTVLPVKYRHATFTGTNSNKKVIVAKEILILKEETI